MYVAYHLGSSFIAGISKLSLLKWNSILSSFPSVLLHLETFRRKNVLMLFFLQKDKLQFYFHVNVYVDAP